MPGLALTKQGCFDADAVNALNASLPGIVYSYSASTSYTLFNAGAAVTMVAALAPAGTYRITLYGITTTTFTTATEEVITFGWTDDQGARTVVYTTAAESAGTMLPPLSATVNNSMTIRSTGAAAITWTPSVTGSNAGAGAMAISIVVERLV